MFPSTATLRERLLDEARTILSSEGIDAVGIREVARRAGVSHGAPRRHFASRQQLLAALAVEGFAELRTRIESAADASEEPRGRLVAAGQAYVLFARTHAALFDLMFRHDLLEASGQGLRATSLPLLETIAGPLRESLGREPDNTAVVGLWSALHGVAVLSAGRSLDVLRLRPVDLALVEHQVDRWLRD